MKYDWHFLPKDCRLTHDDGREARVGETLEVDGAPRVGCWGLHGAKTALGALSWAPGPVVCLVELGGEIDVSDSLRAAQTRKVVAMADATPVLHEYACDVAETRLLRDRVAGREPDVRSWNVIAVKRKWLKGEATDAELAEAWAAARAAAWAAERAAERAAAWDAAWDAARAATYAAWAAAWDAAEAAGCAAARDAAGAAAWDAGWDAARAAAWAAAEAAAWDAARAAESDRLNAELEHRLLALLGMED